MGKPNIMSSRKVIREHMEGGPSVGEMLADMKKEDAEREEERRAYERQQKVSEIINSLQQELIEEDTTGLSYQIYFAVSQVYSGFDSSNVYIDVTPLIANKNETDRTKSLEELQTYVQQKFVTAGISDITIHFIGVNDRS